MITTGVHRQLQTFIDTFGRPHLDLACHGAFPMALTPDLLYRLWANFRTDVQGQPLQIPWVAVADLLLAPFCLEVGSDLYEIEPAIRATLLQRLRADPRFGPPRLTQLADFLLTYHSQSQLDNDDPDLRELAQIQRWCALAQTQPTQVVRELAQSLLAVPDNDGAEWGRMAALVQRLQLPPNQAHPLQHYSQAMAHLTQGNLPLALEHFRQLPGRRQVTVAGVLLPVPEAVQQQSPQITRRRLLQAAGWLAVGAVGGVLVHRRLAPEMPSPPITPPTTNDQSTPAAENQRSSQESSTALDRLQHQEISFPIEVAMVNVQGNQVLRQQRTVLGQRWSLGDEFELEVVNIPASTELLSANQLEPQQRQAALQQALADTEAIPTPGSKVEALSAIATAHGQLGDRPTAQAILEEALAIATGMQETTAKATALESLVATYEAVWGRPLPPEDWDFVPFMSPEAADAFLMGSPEDEPQRYDDEGPQHWVQVPAFAMGRYPVTQAQWRFVAQQLPRVNRDLEPEPSYFQGDDRPVEQVSWHMAVEFCDRISALLGTPCRLPSEAEWEYACRAGTTTPFHFGQTITPDLANYDGEAAYGQGPTGAYREETTPVGSFGVANAFGLYDMHGNVWEWCQDVWHDSYAGAPTDGSAWLEGGNQSLRLLRGGAWYDIPRGCRSAYRSPFSPDNRDLVIGFRVVWSAART